MLIKWLWKYNDLYKDFINAKSFLHVSKKWNCTFEDIDIGVQIFGDRLQHHHVGQQGGELPVQLHFVIADDVQHSCKQFHSL